MIKEELYNLVEHLSDKNEGNAIVKMIDCSRMIVRGENGFKPLDKIKTAVYNNYPTKTDNIILKMSKKNYSRVLRRHRIELLKLDLEDYKCIMLTLSTAPEFGIDYDTLIRYMKNFNKQINRNFGTPISIKRIEHGGKSQMIHSHYLLFFKDSIPKLLTKK